MNLKTEKEDTLRLEITSYASEGKALGRYGNIVVFVKGAVPGDVVDVRIFRRKKNYWEGVIKNIHTESSDRTQPFCSHFGTCGGCTWQNLSYEKQLFFKENQVKEQLERIGKISNIHLQPILRSPETLFYRNKIEFTFHPLRWLYDHEIGKEIPSSGLPALGFHIPGKFDKILDIDECYLQPEPSNAIRRAAKEIALKLKMEFYDPKKHEGLLRNLLIRNNASGEFLVAVMLKYEDKERRTAFLNELAERFPEIVSLWYVINPKLNDAWSDLEVIHFKGQKFLNETMEDLTFRIGPKSFFQTNTHQALNLYRIVREYAGLTGTEMVYDFYTGTGTIALFLSRQAGKVVGLEYVNEAVEDAKINTAVNNIENAVFYAGDIRKIFSEELMKKEGKPDVLIMDPPRNGVHEDIIREVLKASPERIVYVSCNPATQARDIALLSSSYRLIKVQPVDMFPHTMHVENVALLEKIN
ncbi:MAG: 23S rRNA (uracil(1939)-C(5))-methyltransferase RlmD [Bacteroidales bacterium]